MLATSRSLEHRLASFRCPSTSQRTLVRVRSADDGGIRDLITRDRKEVQLNPDAFSVAPSSAAQPQQQGAEAAGTAAAQAAPAPAAANRTASSSGRTLKSRIQRQQDMAAAAEGSSSSSGPKRCKQAIDAGLELFQQRKFQEAIDMFNLALELPGNGAYRMPGSPREYSCPSDAEEQAALYNMACCYCQMGQREAALTCIEAAFEAGFTDVATLTSDPDLASIRGGQLQSIVGKYTGVGAVIKNVAGLFDKNKPKELRSDEGKNKPWILW